ncbi:hypothetical protein LTR62_001879 [Meristemomyces frigidus]|uniref:ABM domain-containing protein n=1 Tax=Meristemomyces frigidus TaxID=1508187 RepID=A0AAN7T912_9PEZI|nr:hypothetical protein LTR62_001879 [Meristemomyces frigidus]
MSQAHIFAIFTPAPGKTERVRDLLKAQSSAVHQKESYAVRFLLTEKAGENGADAEFWLFETYESMEATEQHVTEPHFKTMIEALEKESMLAKPPVVAKTRTVAGFDVDRAFSGA